MAEWNRVLDVDPKAHENGGLLTRAVQKDAGGSVR